MILTRLYELAERERMLDDPAFETLPVPFMIKVGKEGEFLGIEERRGTIAIPSRKKNAAPKTRPDKGRETTVPKPHGNTANRGFARYFVDTLNRVLPLTDAEVDPKSANSRATFWRQIDEAAAATRDPALGAMAAFGARLSADAALVAQIRAEVADAKPAPGDRCGFLWHPDAGATLLDRDAIRNWYRIFFRQISEQRQESAAQGLCQITGGIGPLPRSHTTKIAGLPGGIASGVSLVSYDKAAFESYSLDGAANAGIGDRAAEGYPRALNALLANKLAARQRTHFRLGGISFVYWTKDPSGQDELSLFDSAEPNEIRSLLESLHAGRLSHAADANQFYCLCLSANAARAIVRDYLELPLGMFRRNMAGWFDDLTIVDGFTGEPTCSFPLWLLVAATHRQGDDPPPDLSTTLMLAAIKNLPLPSSVLAACLRRIRVESGSFQFSPQRMGLIRLILNRSLATGETPMSESLDDRAADPGYVCGRLFACLAYIQAFERDPKQHGYGQEAQMLSGYYGAASAAPRAVFGTLLRQTQHRLNKLGAEHGGFVNNRSKELEEFARRLGQPADWSGDFPSILTLPQQGRFALGFYHQRAAYRPARTKSEPSIEAASQS